MEPRAQEVEWVQRLRDLRRLMGWSQRRLARELRVTPGAVSQWESSQRAVPGPVKRLVEIYEQTLGMVDPPGAPGPKKINGSWSHRTLRASTTTARMVTRLAGSSLRSLVASNARATEIKRATQLAIAQEVAATLGELKGLPMKIGQMASCLAFAAPEHVREVLQTLQHDTSPMSEAAVRTVFQQSFSQAPEAIFERWEPRPFAAASIGQVHRARLEDGTEVAVKVQYPGIRQALDSDLTTLGALDQVSSLVFRGQGKSELLKELRERLLEECDYVREAKNQEEFRRIYAGNPRVVIPRVHWRFSSDRILATDYIEGRRFAAFVREADQASKDRAGEVIFRVSTGSIFKHLIFNGDPHPGNYLFLDTGQVAFLDFGCVKRFTPDLVERWARYGTAVAEGRRADADKLIVKMGFVPDPESFDFDYHYEMMRQLHEPWLSETPFRFNKHYVERNWSTLVIENPNRTRTRVPPDLLLANRLQWGLHSVLAELGAQADWKSIFEDNMASALRNVG